MADRHLVGLDIGSKYVKAVQLTGSSGQYRITEFGVAEVSPQASVPDVVAELFSRKSFKTKRVVTAVSGRFVFVRYISMPVMSDEELANAAKYELGKYIPVEVEEVLHDSQKLEELAPQEGQEPEMRVLLVAAKRTFIDEHVALLETAGLQPHIIDVDSFALGNAYELTGSINPQAIAPGKLVALVDIGASKTNINIMTDAVSYFTREFYKGGDDLTDSISKKLSLEVREAEMLKRGAAPVSAGSPSTNVPIVMVDSSDADKLRAGSAITRGPLTSVGGLPSGPSGGGGGEADRVYECISGILDDICHDINISIDYFENQYDKKVDEIYLTGGGALTVGLQETLERTVQKPVTRWNPLQFFEQRLSAESEQELQDYAFQGIIALGLASRIVG
jgi:type IV pilus assembly protein PilM